MSPRIRLSALALVLLTLGVLAGVVRADPGDRADNLAGRLAVAVERNLHKEFRGSVAVWDADATREIYTYQAGVRRRPASVIKLVSSGAALLSFGPDGELETLVHARARPGPDGRLAGPLVVRGYGDPGFAARFGDGDAEAVLRGLARDVRAAGIRLVGGDLVVDGSAFPDSGRRADWGWKPWQTDWWMAPVTAIVLNDNCLDVNVTPGAAVGRPARLEIAPRTSLIQFDNRLPTVADRKSHSVAFAQSSSDSVLVRGGCWVGSGGLSSSLACIEPHAAFGDVFRRLLAEEGVRIEGGTRTVVDGADGLPEPACNTLIARHGTRVADVAAVCNTRSQNLYAELLLRAVGRRELGEGSATAGARAARDLLAVPRSAEDELVQVDGSGLSRGNQVTARMLGHVLLRMWRSPYRAEYLATLAEGGDPDGTLRTRFRGDKFDGRLRAKTGTLRDTKCLAGYARGHGDTTYAFVILCEGANWRGQKLADAVVDALIPSDAK